MTVLVFVDTNIFFYAMSDGEPGKGRLANRLLNSLTRPVINGQVIRELGQNLRKKAGYGEENLRKMIRKLYLDCVVMTDHETIFLQASRLRDELGVSYWDSLIVAAALAADCSILYSEDMQHGQIVDGRLQVINPLRTETE